MHLDADTHLTYCMNIHPAETADDVMRAIERHPPQVRQLLGKSGPMGLGLRLSRRAVDELAKPDRIDSLKHLSDSKDSYVFTINGFPYGAFHGHVVKDRVYAPDWRTQERLEYTYRLIDVLAACLPSGCEGSISTVPVSYKTWMISPGDEHDAVDKLIRCVLFLHQTEQRTGRYIHLGLEPEPDCYLENTADVLGFYEKVLLPQGCRLLQGVHGIAEAKCESLIRRHLGICVDVCHMAIAFENPTVAIERMIKAGILISKVQLSAALAMPSTSASIDAIKRFDDSVYLHQVKIAGKRQGSESWKINYSFPDIPQAMANWPILQSHDECRVHVHVPLYWDGQPPYGSTNHLLDENFWATLKKNRIRHLEIETYTFSVLPPEFKNISVEESIAREYKWVLDRV